MKIKYMFMGSIALPIECALLDIQHAQFSYNAVIIVIQNPTLDIPSGSHIGVEVT